MTARACDRCGDSDAHYSVQERAWLCASHYFAGSDKDVTGLLPEHLRLPTTQRYPGTSKAEPDEAYDRLEAHERRRRRRKRPKLPTVAEIASRLRERGLRPVVDPALDLVRAKCPDCRAGETDPLGLWRPMAVMSSELDGRVISFCDHCGSRDV
jgi:hypothetical protein